MENKRKYDRWNFENVAVVECYGQRKEVKVLDVSLGGMRISTSEPIEANMSLTGEFKILPNIGPFFVQGRVIWTTKRDNNYESGVVFDRVSTIPLS